MVMLNRTLARELQVEGRRLQSEGSNKCYAYYNAAHSMLELEDLTREDVLGMNIKAKYIGPRISEWLVEAMNSMDKDTTKEFERANTNPHKHYTPRNEVLKKIEPLVNLLDERKVNYEMAGSYRRVCPAVGDMDILVFEPFPDISQIDCEVVAKGERLMKLKFSELEVDMRSFSLNEKGCALLFYTGPRNFNIWLRGRARKEGYKLNEYYLEDLKTKERYEFDTEEEVFGKLNLVYVPPELREQWR